MRVPSRRRRSAGYASTAGEQLIRVELLEEAVRLGRILAELLPTEGTCRADGAAALLALARRPAQPCVAIGMAFGPRAALEIVDALAEEPVLDGYHLLAAVRGDLLLKLGRHEELVCSSSGRRC